MSAVDWELASSLGRRFVKPGPEVSSVEAQEVVADLNRSAAAAVEPVRRTTGLVADQADHRTIVVDRAAWIDSNVTGMRLITAALERHLDDRRDPHSAMALAGSKATAVQVGTMLSWVATKVLGQFEAVTPPGEPGRLLLVAPNIVATERRLEIPSADFRMWVCLHEETHRVQFGAVPWLSDHFTSEVHTYLAATDDDARSTLARVLAGVRDRVPSSANDEGESGQRPGLLDLVQSPEQRDILDRLTALMSLLEGHADVVMDEVGPIIVPSVAVIRARFNQRRHRASGLDGALRRLLGLDRKMRQYTEGAGFVRGVVDRIGMSGFNAVWSGPENLPALSEIADPAAWIARVHG